MLSTLVAVFFVAEGVPNERNVGTRLALAEHAASNDEDLEFMPLEGVVASLADDQAGDKFFPEPRGGLFDRLIFRGGRRLERDTMMKLQAELMALENTVSQIADEDAGDCQACDIWLKESESDDDDDFWKNLFGGGRRMERADEDAGDRFGGRLEYLPRDVPRQLADDDAGDAALLDPWGDDPWGEPAGNIDWSKFVKDSESPNAWDRRMESDTMMKLARELTALENIVAQMADEDAGDFNFSAEDIARGVSTRDWFGGRRMERDTVMKLARELTALEDTVAQMADEDAGDGGFFDRFAQEDWRIAGLDEEDAGDCFGCDFTAAQWADLYE